jgi:putative colanic acid biosynthesis acetyltransferase WcaF
MTHFVLKNISEKCPGEGSMRKTVQFNKYDNSWYNPGSYLKRIFWHLTSLIFFSIDIPAPYSMKCAILRLFGSKVGKNTIIKPSVRVKYPWFLDIGDNVWIGERTWLDNLTHIKIGNNVCISQGVYIFTGNHNYNKVTFDLSVEPVIFEDGVWVGAYSVVCPSITMRTHSVLAAGSVLTKDTEPYSIYQGSPAKKVREREIEE